MRWNQVRGRGDMFVRPPLPDWFGTTRSTIPLYGMGRNLGREKFHYQLPNAMQEWGWDAQTRAMNREEQVRFGGPVRFAPPPRMGPPNPMLSNLVKSMASMSRPAPKPPPSIMLGGPIQHMPRMPPPKELPRRAPGARQRAELARRYGPPLARKG